MANKKIKGSQVKPTVSKSDGQKDKQCEQNLAVSLKYLTHNDKYNFSHFSDSEKNDKKNAALALYEWMAANTGVRWNELFMRPKQSGAETIPMDRLKFEPYGISKNEFDKFISFRFNSAKSRIIGIKDGDCPILYIIGFDFDFSAYEHG